MQAIILAAGMGKRLKELTKSNTKCMVKVNNVTLIDRMLHQIEKKNLSRIVIVIGYEGQKLVEYVNSLGIRTPIVFINNPIYDKTNNIYSLALASDWLCREDTLLFESDIIFEDSVLDKIIDDPRDTLALVDKYEPWMDGTCLKLSDDDTIREFIAKKNFRFDETNLYYKTVNIYKFSRQFSKNYYVPFLHAYQAALGENEYYEQVLRVITMLDDPVIKGKRLAGERWYEIDDIQDLVIAESIFTDDDDEKLSRIESRYGGYWRYPRLLDFCYIVNPYFPSERLIEEMKANFGRLLTSYPSGMHGNCLLAAKIYGIRPENVVVGNGSAELIKSLMHSLEGKTGFVRPTFEEYPNRYAEENSVVFHPDNSDFSYSYKDIIDFFEPHHINNLILINPDNPSGNYIPKKDMLQIVSWASREKINLIIDESFVDFSDEQNASLIDQDFIDSNPHLYLMKSISKTYGVPGLRLGVLVSGNVNTVSRIKKDVSIWNINSFAEFFMQIEEKYKDEYAKGLDQLKAERGKFEAALSKIKGFRVIPSQANYVMIELDKTIPARYLTKKLLVDHDLFIKDLTAKMGGKNYIRLAVRSAEENEVLLIALRQELGVID